ncbi:hypothetical protein GCM10007425_04090 [Lysinibacillus alkalisoli]|uniref:Uncharacterized protein n=1 Tax=Lysinibacillus alkalisoli TaxID=1911548 RepID=A0A917FVU3_9BACI|nr:DUF6526 family protein [Lysinibacillus alkalisoli]GGG12965.1 hypothetical protein GCM10007425_04090 [Lysinibacillus alkalisoli]
MQSYNNHSRKFPLQHYIWLPLSLLSLLSAIYLLITNFSLLTLLIATTLVVAIIGGMLARLYGLKLQDRIIRLEEQFRYYTLTQQPLSNELTLQQLIALRFASDDEYLLLVDKAIKEKLSPDDIKRTIQQWRADHQRI